jgi:perosamine synthetase
LTLRFIPVNSPLITLEDQLAVQNELRQGWISGDSPVVSQFEEAFAAMVGRKHGIAVNSGTDALDLAINSLDLSPGDEVILPTFAISSIVNEVVRSGARPIFVDIDENWNLDIPQVLSHLNDKTRAVVAVHTYGMPVDMDALESALLRFPKISLIEDAAEVHGQSIRGKPCGSFGKLSTFSFYSNKNITCGEGGMVLTDDDELSKKLRSRRNLGFRAHQRFVSDDLAWNMRMTAMQAALGKSQLPRIAEIVNQRLETHEMYKQVLSTVNGITFQTSNTEWASNHYWVVGILLESDRFPDADIFLKEMFESGVGGRPFFQPLHRQPFILRTFPEFRHMNFPKSDYVARRGFYPPNGLGTPIGDIVTAAERLRELLLIY